MYNSQSDAEHEQSIKKVNNVLGAAYVVLGILSIIQVFTKYLYIPPLLHPLPLLYIHTYIHT